MPMTAKIKHHLSPQLLMAYAAGALPEAFDLVVASHLSLCDACRAEAESYETLGGAVLENEDAVALDEDSLAATLRLIETGLPEPAEAAVPAAAPGEALPAPVRVYVGGGLDDVRWQNIGRGVKQALLPMTGEARARLLYIPAGMAVPDHGHSGAEVTLVLRGAFSDKTDRFGPGDVEIADEKLHHSPVAEEGEDCICLAVTDAPLRFSGLVPRLAQPFLQI